MKKLTFLILLIAMAVSAVNYTRIFRLQHHVHHNTAGLKDVWVIKTPVSADTIVYLSFNGDGNAEFEVYLNINPVITDSGTNITDDEFFKLDQRHSQAQGTQVYLDPTLSDTGSTLIETVTNENLGAISFGEDIPLKLAANTFYRISLSKTTTGTGEFFRLSITIKEVYNQTIY